MKQTIAILLAAFSLNVAKAQYDHLITQYMFNEMFINPAYTGSRDNICATLLHRQQWISFAGRPITTSFSAHGPIRQKNMGVGISVMNEKIGVLTRNLLYASYAYKVKLKESQYLSMGLMGGMETQANRYHELLISDDAEAPADPLFDQNTANLISPNFGAGLYYHDKKFYAGISAPRFLENRKIAGSDGSIEKSHHFNGNAFTYYLTAGYFFTLDDELKLKTNAMLKAIRNAPMQLDVNANLLMNDKIWLGLGFRSGASGSVLIGYAGKLVSVYYSYDLSFSKMQRYSKGSHELVLDFLLPAKKQKPVMARPEMAP